MKYAIQTKFLYGWDYMSAWGGEQVLYDTKQEAQEGLDELLLSWSAQSVQEGGAVPAIYSASYWRAAEYTAAEMAIIASQGRNSGVEA